MSLFYKINSFRFHRHMKNVSYSDKTRRHKIITKSVKLFRRLYRRRQTSLSRAQVIHFMWRPLNQSTFSTAES